MTPHTVLVADDNHDAADTLALLLEMHAHRVLTAYDGPHAIELAEQHCPRLLILDIHMPGLDGYETASRIRRACRHPMVIAALTGVPRADEGERARAAGFDFFFLKPIETSVLDMLVEAAERLPDAAPPPT